MTKTKWRVGDQITHGDELDYAPCGGGGKASYAVLPGKAGADGLMTASVAVVDECGIIVFWEAKHKPVHLAMEFLELYGMPKDYDPDDELN